MKQPPPREPERPGRTGTKTLWRQLIGRTLWGEYEYLSMGRSIIAAASVVVALIGVIAILDIRDSGRRAQIAQLIEVNTANAQESARGLELQHDFSLVNLTSATISVWVREDATPPPSPGASIEPFHPIGCEPPRCGIRQATTESFPVQRQTDDPDALMAISAWLSTTGEIVYSDHLTQRQLDNIGWRILVTDEL